jgi:hypothetical protein
MRLNSHLSTIMKACARCGLAMNDDDDSGFCAVAEPSLKKIDRYSIFSKDVSNFSIYMKVTIISLGLVKVFILNELNENVIECQKEKVGQISSLSSLRTIHRKHKSSLLLLRANMIRNMTMSFLDYNCSVASLNKSQNIDYFQYLIPNYT